jgi:hypothetical protein
VTRWYDKPALYLVLAWLALWAMCTASCATTGMPPITDDVALGMRLAWACYNLPGKPLHPVVITYSNCKGPKSGAPGYTNGGGRCDAGGEGNGGMWFLRLSGEAVSASALVHEVNHLANGNINHVQPMWSQTLDPCVAVLRAHGL